jgi:U3 small nucleolar RNA-associated protein 11
MSSRSKGGVKVANRGNNSLSQDVAKLLKTQDAGYIRTMLQSVRKDRQRMEEQVLLGEEEVTTLKDESRKRKKGKEVPRHMVFVDAKEEQDEFAPEEWFGVKSEDLDKAWNRPRRRSDVKDAESLQEEPPEWTEEREQHKAKLQRELEALKAKEQALQIASEELDTQRAKMNNQLGGVNKNGVRWKVRARKR